MNILDLPQFLRDLWLQGVEFWLEGDQLRFRGNKNLINGDTLALLRDNKPAIIEIIRAAPQAYLGFPLSHGQRSIYLMQNLAPQSAAYNLACLFKTANDLNLGVLESSLDFLLQRHAPLRMSIETLDGHLAQQVSYSLPSILNVSKVDILGETQLLQWARQQADQPFNLASEPLIRARLLINNSTSHCYLLLVAHHIIADFWAMDLLIKELATIYQAGITDSTPELPDIGKLYKDYVIQERQWLADAQGQAARQYWLEKLLPLPPALELPTDFKRPQQQSFQGKEYRFSLGQPLTALLKEQARQQHVTAFIWVLSIFQTLLHRYTGENCIAIGSPMACRMQHDFQLLAGHFTNPVVLTSDFSKTPVFTDLLSYNKEQLLQAIKYQEYPLQCLIEALHSQRENPNTSLFQTAISWNQASDIQRHSNNLIDRILLTEQRGAVYDLVLTGYDQGDNIELSIRFNTDIFRESSIARMAGHVCSLIEQTCAQGNRSIGDIDFRSTAETALLASINNTGSEIPANTSLAKLFRHSARQYAQLSALKDGDEHYSYAELETHSNRMAHYLYAQGIKPGDHIALCLYRSRDMLVLILAALKCGCTYIPIDTAYPNDRIAYMAMQSQAPLLISSQQLTGKLSELAGQAPDTVIQFIEHINAALDNFSDSFELYNDGDCDDDAIACVLYTSGSTGRPKGVKTPHRAIIRLCKNTNLFTLQPAEKFCYLSNISFDATNLEIWGSFLNGGCLLKVDNDTLLSPQNFAEFIEREKPQAALITTALFNVFISYQPAMFRNMNHIFVGGEALDINPVRRCIEHGKPAHLINIYGPTENGTISTIYEVNDANIQVIPIGKPISNSQVYIHDKYGKPAPLGVMGEIFVGGEGISTGYMKQPELTAEKFVADQYRGKGLLYATGDLGYFREDGELMYAGRRDDQVKIRGYRIELGEIEQCLSLHPNINECCVVVNKDTDIATLHAYYSADTTLDSATIKAFLRQSLPEFMIPSATLQMPAMPINPNGKVDKRQLPAIKAEIQQGHVAPRNATEQAIATIWQQQMHIDTIGIYDHFFEIGGHSLLAIRVASAIQDTLHTEVSMRMLFEHPTVASLAEAILHDTGNTLPEITAFTDNSSIPAALSQQRLWFLQQLNPASCAYNMPVALRIVKPLNAAHIQACLQTLILRHDALRTTFTDTNGIACLHIHDVIDWHLPQVDLSHLTDTIAEAQAKNALAELAQHTFDLENELLFKSLLIRLSADEYILAFCLHHIIADGLSVDILLRELACLWQQSEANLASILPAQTIRYADFSAWQHRFLQGDLLETQLAYWQQQLAGAPTLLDLPTDKPRPAVLGSNGASHEFTIPAHTASRLKTLSQHNGATLFMTLLAAYSLLLSRYSQQTDLCIGFPIAGRTQKSLENIVGLFVNNLVVRCNLAENVSINTYLQQIKRTTIDAYAHQDIPFDMIIDALKTERSLSHIPFLQASFSLESSHFSEKIANTMGSDVRHEKLDWHVAKYDLHLSCHETGGHHLTATLEYNTELFEPATIEKISRHYLALLNAMAENPHTAIDDIQFLSELEYQQQMDFNNGWNATAYAYPPAESLHELIEQQAQATPHAIALIDDNTRLSYEELNTRSNRLAHYLRTLGVTRNQPVAICLERSVHMSVALLAILKAGGAYVPLTTDIPASRINYICNDTGARIFISTTTQTFAGLHINASRINADDNHAWQDFPASNPEAITHKDDLVNIIYTSGSTGNPKGVMVPHRGIINRLRWMQHAYPIGLHDRVLQKTPFNFDVSVWELFWPLMQGSTLVFAKAEGHKDPDYLRDLIIHHGITTLHFVPSMLGVFLQTADIEQCRSIKYLFASGEALQPGHCQTFFQRLPGAGLFNLYGPTEASIDVSFYNCTAQETHSSIAIGKPIHNTQLHILDKNLKVLPIGVAGDLYIGGEGLALGYWNQEALTRNTFIENPWHAKGHPSKRLYKTGDVARYRSDGNIEYLGRSDHQIKIRGLRVELGEIETAISKLPDIHECIVVLTNTDPANQRLIAYLLTGNANVDTTTIAQTLKASLPEYMVPAAFVCLQEWPLSANGKIDRKRLPEPPSSTTSYYEAPRNATEQTLADIWQNLLDTEKIGIHDNFFELGGHSLLATQLASRIRTALACSLELKAIFEHPTIAELAIHLLEQEMRALDMDDADLLAMLNEIDN